MIYSHDELPLDENEPLARREAVDRSDENQEFEMPSMARPLVEIHELRRIYQLAEGKQWVGKRELFHGLSQAIGQGELVLIQGTPNSGKTTLLQLLAGYDRLENRDWRRLIEPSGVSRKLAMVESFGQIRVNGMDMAKTGMAERASWTRHHLGCVMAEIPLEESLSTLENVALPLRLCGYSRRESEQRAYDLLATMGLRERAFVSPLALGELERQRAYLTRALVNQPQLLLIEGAMVEGISDLHRILRKLRRREGTTIFLTLCVQKSHRIRDIRATCVLTLS